MKVTKNGVVDLEQILRMTQEELKEALTEQLSELGYAPVNKQGYLYAEGVLPVLLVAHLDTVHREPVRNICSSQDGRFIMSPQGIGGDDRAGVYMVLKLLEQAPCHVLFCEDEEIGGHGARRFTQSGLSPSLHYIVELDRRGHNDAVFYDCDNREFVRFVEQFGFQEDYGSFSDISVVAPYMGVAAVNISAGYYNEHQLHEHINLSHVEDNIDRILKMVQSPSELFPYIPKKSMSWGEPAGMQLPLWDMGGTRRAERQLALMPLPETAYVKVSGKKVDNGLFHFIDKRGKVYDYIEEVDAVVLSERTAAYGKDDEPIKYQSKKAQHIRVLTLEETLERLSVG